MFKKIILTFLLLVLSSISLDYTFAENTEPVYTKFRVVDAGTFNEFRYKIADEFFNFRNNYNVNGNVDVVSARKLFGIISKSYKYLPDSLINKNYYNYLKSALAKGIKYPNNTSNYTSIITSLENYLDKTNIQTIKGSVQAFPKEGNAPLNVTLRGNVRDPSGTAIPKYNYVWWMQVDGKRKVLGNNISLNHIFNNEGNFAIFLDVKSEHKNKLGYTDVLSFSSRADIVIKEKVASVILKVNSSSLRNKSELKFTPDEAKYGLLFDATSSTPTSGSDFIKTTWDFGNGITKSYNGSPKVERVLYVKEGEYNVSLKLETNELKRIERKFKIIVHNPIATIKASSEEGFLGDKFTFSSKKSGNDKNLSYSWEIIDLNNDKVIFKKAGTLFTYVFRNKGKFNVKMKVVEPSGQTDIDTKIIYINSRPPVADFSSKIPFPNKPNKVFLDATKSFDLDVTDDGKLKYTWIIDGNRIALNKPNFNGSTGYYTFDSIGEHSVSLEVEDPDKIVSIKKGKVLIKSILSVEFFVFPRVAQRTKTLRFVSSSPEAKFYEWDFGDGTNKGGREANIGHAYKKSGIYKVILKVRDTNDKINTFTKNVYIGESDAPYAFMSIKDNSESDIIFDDKACDGKGAYILNRVDSVQFSGSESINITGETNGLTYSWKLGKASYKNSKDFKKKFDELGCFPIKLTVKSDDNGKTSSITSNVEVRNLKPTLSSVDVRVVDATVDPVIVNVSALGSKDRDGVIQSYLWYYYTDIDSEPQDFRATKSPSTSFVLPKVTGNYYFVVVMKDNNEARINSEEITGSKYFMTLTGDNLNTPLVRLSINNSSVAIGDEVIFTANVQNILGQDLSKKVKYSWDFDGDGFYDKESTLNTVTYKYVSSGEKHAKVKAKYKGFSNTKTVTVEVSNVLKPDFGYISIGNKYIYFYNGLGTAEHLEWDLGDETKITDKNYFIHEYTDHKVTHLVDLKVSEGTKFKSIEKKVVKNVKNIILSRKSGLISFISPKINNNNEIVLNNIGDSAFIYLGETKGDVVNYVIDNDIENDSNLNGGNDDDEDNKDLPSYTDGSIIKVVLNNKKYQKIRVYTKNSKGIITDSKDYTIVKNYVEEKAIDINSINFEGISDSIKLKIERLKNYIDGLPKQYKLKGSMYIQKLQEEWSDSREKTNVILEFEGFIDDTGVDNKEDIINLLEGLIVENQEDKSDKAITYNALKNLIPTTILCKDEKTLEDIKCYDTMVAKLDAIKSNDNIDENKLLGTEILKVIAVDKVMTNKEKTDFKAILKTFIYGGVTNIPNDVKEEVINSDNGGLGLLDLIYSIFKWIFIIILLLLGFIVIFYAYFKFFNKDSNLGFQDFIIEKTSGEKKKKTIIKDTFEEDLLSDLANNEPEVEEIKKTPIVNSSPSEEKDITVVKEEAKNEINDTKKEPKIESKKESNDKVETSTKSEEVPDWLKGSFSEEVKEEAKNEINDTKKAPKIEDKKESNKKVNKEEIKKESKENIKSKPENINSIRKGKIEKKDIIKKEKESIDSKKNDDDNIPDWLKGSFSEEVQKKEIESDEIINKSISNGKIEKVDSTQSDDNIPDWLKGSFSEDKKEDKIVKEDKKEIKSKSTKSSTLKNSKKIKTDTIKKDITEIKKSKIITEKKSATKNLENKKSKKIVDENINDKTNVIKKEALNIKDRNEDKKVDSNKKNNVNKSSELWDDGMKVPDWLKSDTDK